MNLGRASGVYNGMLAHISPANAQPCSPDAETSGLGANTGVQGATRAECLEVRVLHALALGMHRFQDLAKFLECSFEAPLLWGVLNGLVFKGHASLSRAAGTSYFHLTARGDNARLAPPRPARD
jgi:hypothetical protein